MSKKYFLKVICEGIFYLPLSLLYVLSYIVPKNNKIWIFGAWFGEKFNDNSKYLYLYVLHNQPSIRPIWLTKNKKVIREMKEEGYECYYTYSLKGFYYSIQSGIAIVCQGTVDVNRFVLGRKKKIQLWHGTPLKKIHFDAKKKNKISKIEKLYQYTINTIYPFFKEDKFDLYIASSPEVKKKICTAFNVTPENVSVTGYPRNDVFSDNHAQEMKKINYDLLKSIEDHKIIVTYLPTFRDVGVTFDQLFSKYNFNFEKWNKYFEIKNIIFICKPHNVDKSTKTTSLKSDSIKFFDDNDIPDIYPLLKVTDILITDYSSVYFDYLIMDRPIIFTPFDFHEYITKDRELYYDYNLVTPGPKAYNWDQVMKFITEAINEPEKYQKERTETNKIFNTYTDCQSSKRIYQKIIEILE